MGEPTGNKGGLLGAHRLMKMDMITVEVRAEVAGKGVKVDDRDAGSAHDRIGNLIIGVTVSGKAVEGHVWLVVDPFITRGGSDPDESGLHGRNEGNYSAQIVRIPVNVDLSLAGLWIGFDVVQAAVKQEQIGVNAALLRHAA